MPRFFLTDAAYNEVSEELFVQYCQDEGGLPAYLFTDEDYNEMKSSIEPCEFSHLAILLAQE